MQKYESILEVLEEHAITRPDKIAYRYLEDGDNVTATVTYEQLAVRGRAIAAWLQANGLRGARVALPIRHDLAFIEALLGCLYASVVAVPTTIPHRNRELEAFNGILENSRASAILLSRHDAALHGPLSQSGRSIDTLFVEDAPDGAPDWSGYECRSSDLAFLQYTSGSTGAPKGVTISHGNLMSNEHAIQVAMQLNENAVFVSWLPLFHDMGLIGSVLQPLYLGGTCVLMPPRTFLVKPLRWLNAIHKYRGTTSGAPNFAYELCVEKSTPEQRAQLDLSSWTVAFNGSEPVRPATLDRFANAFAVSRFSRRAFYPCYGMAESTLMISGPRPGTEPVTRRLAPNALEVGRNAAELQDAQREILAAGCGSAVVGTQIAIVDPQTRAEVQPGSIGEIWISGPSITSGYFNSAEANLTTVGQFIEGRGATPFLRTGDLGCVLSGTLFIVGRLKDIVVIRGRKHHPQDLEQSAERSNQYLAPGGGAAFPIDDTRGESLVIVHELTRQGWRLADPREVAADVREALVREHGVAPARIALIKPGTLPRTTSGKVRRSQCKELLLSDHLEEVDAEALCA